MLWNEFRTEFFHVARTHFSLPHVPKHVGFPPKMSSRFQDIKVKRARRKLWHVKEIIYSFFKYSLNFFWSFL